MKYLFATFLFIFGVSVANVIRGKFEFAFYFVLLVLCVIKKVKLPLFYILIIFFGIILQLNPFFREVEIKSIVYFVAPIVEGYLIAFGIYYLAGIDSVKKLNVVFMCYLLFQITIVISMFIFPDFRKDLLIYMFLDDISLGDAFSKAFAFRGYGLSRHFLFGFPLAIAFIVSSIFFSESIGLKSKFLFLLLSITLCVLNARTGILIILLSLTFYVITNRNGIKLLAITVLISLSLFPLVLGWTSDDNFQRYVKWLSESMSIFNNIQENGTVRDLSNMIFFPNDFYHIAFGHGIVLMPGNANYSDIGIIRAMFSGGVLFLLTLFSLFMLSFSNIAKMVIVKRRILRNVFFVLLIVSFTLAMIKGDAYLISDYSRVVFLSAFLSFFINSNKGGDVI